MTALPAPIPPKLRRPLEEPGAWGFFTRRILRSGCKSVSGHKTAQIVGICWDLRQERVEQRP